MVAVGRFGILADGRPLRLGGLACGPAKFCDFLRQHCLQWPAMVRLSDPPAIIEFGHLSILPHRRQLLADGRPIRLGGRAFDLLLALIDAPGAVVGKDELLNRIWPGRIVEESRLQSEISALRKALGTDRDLIQTVSGRGYQFTGEIRELGTGVSPRQVPAPLAVPAPLRPATNLSESASELIDREAALAEVTDLVTHSEAERRQITAMSCEAIGLATRADGGGLEDLAEAIGAFQQCVSKIVGRHSGSIASRLGNTVLVLFGYPAAARRRRRAGDPCGARHDTLTQHLPTAYRLGVAARVECAEIAAIEQIADQTPGGRLDRHGVRLRRYLQPHRQVRGVSDNPVIPHLVVPEEIANDDHSRGYADPAPHRHVGVGSQDPDRRTQFEPTSLPIRIFPRTEQVIVSPYSARNSHR
jgi:DNA-binding winged helix-turn-helix (wHTH) protein